MPKTTNLLIPMPDPGNTTSWGVDTTYNAGNDAGLNYTFQQFDALFAPQGNGSPVGLNVGSGKKLVIAGTLQAGGINIFGTGDGTGTLAGAVLRGPNGSGSNVAGVDFVVQPGNGTGTGGSGKFIFRMAAPATSGSTANSLTDVLTVNQSGRILLANGADYNATFVGLASSGASNYTLATTDGGGVVEMTSSTACTLTVPPDSTVIPVGTQVTIVQLGTGQVTLTPGAGVTINAILGALKLSNQYAAATLYKRSANSWVAFGSLVT